MTGAGPGPSGPAGQRLAVAVRRAFANPPLAASIYAQFICFHPAVSLCQRFSNPPLDWRVGRLWRFGGMVAPARLAKYYLSPKPGGAIPELQ